MISIFSLNFVIGPCRDLEVVPEGAGVRLCGGASKSKSNKGGGGSVLLQAQALFSPPPSLSLSLMKNHQLVFPWLPIDRPPRTTGRVTVARTSKGRYVGHN